MEEAEAEENFQEIITPLIFQLSWEDIWLAEILPKLDLEDLFRLRGVCKVAYELVSLRFSRLKKVDLTDKRSFNLEHYKVQNSVRNLIVSFSCVSKDYFLICLFQNARQDFGKIDLT